MNKKIIFSILCGLILVNMLSLCIAQVDTTEIQKSAEQIQGVVNKIPINPQTGEVNPEQLGIYKTKAEQRIDKINAWMDNNLFFLKLFFGMKPEISFKFFIDLLLIAVVVNLFVFVVPNFYTIGSKTSSIIIGCLISLVIINSGTLVQTASIIDIATQTWWVNLLIILSLFLIIAIMVYVRVLLLEYEVFAKAEIQRIRQEGITDASEEFMNQAFSEN